MCRQIPVVLFFCLNAALKGQNLLGRGLPVITSPLLLSSWRAVIIYIVRQSVRLMTVRANRRASVGWVSMEKSGKGCESAEAQLEQPRLIQTDSVLQQQQKKRPQQACPAVCLSKCLVACLPVLLRRIAKDRVKERDF